MPFNSSSSSPFLSAPTSLSLTSSLLTLTTESSSTISSTSTNLACYEEVKYYTNVKPAENYYRPCCDMCCRILARYKSLDVREKKKTKKNLFSTSVRRIKDLYRKMRKCLSEQDFQEDFNKAFITSLILFIIGVILTKKLSTEHLITFSNVRFNLK